MPLQWSLLDVPFSGGQSDKGDPRQDGGSIESLTNGYQARTGEIRKRPGYNVLAKTVVDGTAITTAQGIVACGDELLLFDGQRCLVWSPESTAWVDKGMARPVSVLTKRACATVQDGAMAVVNSWSSGEFTAIVFQDQADSGFIARNAKLSIFDNTTGAQVLSEYDLGFTNNSGSGADLGTVVIGSENSTTFYVVYDNPSTAGYINRIVITGVGTSSITVGTSGANITDYNDTWFAVAPGYGGSGFAVAYEDTSADIKVAHFNDAGTYQSSDTVSVSASGADNIRMNKIGNYLYVTYEDAASGDLYMARISSGGVDWNVSVYSPAASHTVEYATVAQTSGTDVVVFVNLVDAAAAISVFKIADVVVDSSGTASSSGYFLNRARLLSDAFYLDGDQYVWVSIAEYGPSGASGGLASAALCRRDAAQTPAFESRLAVTELHDSSRPYSIAFPRRSPQSGLGWPMPKAESITYVTGISYNTTYKFVLEDVTKTGVRAFDINDSFMIDAGLIYNFDGARIHPHGLFQRGLLGSITPATSGGSLADGVYQLAIVYQWKDARGNEFYSEPVLYSGTVSGGGGNGKITVTPYNNLVDAEVLPDMNIYLYNSDTDGAVYYLRKYIANDATAVTGSTYDFATTITSNPTIRSNGGVLSPTAPPAAYSAYSDGTTAFVIPYDDREAIWVSKPIEENVAAEFSNQLVYRVPEGGNNTAIASLDGRTIIFKEDSIRYFVGTPPNALGQLGYSGTQPISSDVGCTEPRSVVEGPFGIVFKSNKGLYLLDRGMQVSYIGAPVETYNSDTIYSGDLMRDIQQVRWCTSSGVTLVWDYFHNAWSVYTSSAWDPIDATVWQGNYTWVDASGNVHVEDSTVFTDNATEYDVVIRSRWVKLGSLNGFQRVRRVGVVGEYGDASADTLQLKMYYDYNDSTAVQTITHDASAVSPSANDPFRLRARTTRQKCEAIQVELTETSDSSAGLYLSGLTFEIGSKTGIGRKGSSRTE